MAFNVLEFPRTFAAVLGGVHLPYEIRELRLQPPQTGEVMVKMKNAGVCGSDLSVQLGKRTHPFPVVTGHEGSGVIEALGPDVRGLRVGDRVALNWQPSCGRCYLCQRGNPNQCITYPERVTPETTRYWMADGSPVFAYSMIGGFSERVVVRRECCVKLPRRIPMEIGCLVGCAVATGVGSVLNVAQIKKGESVVVIGAGGVGLNMILGAVLAGANPIIAVDSSPGKEAMARDFGVTDFFLANDADLLDKIRALTKGFGADTALEAVGRPETQRLAVDVIRSGGRAVLVGLPPTGSEVTLPSRGIVGGEKTVIGSLYGGRSAHDFFPHLFRFYSQGRLPLDRLVSRRYPLSGINDGFDALQRGEVARALIEFPDSPLS